MIVWIDAQLSPVLAPWLEDTFGLTAHAVRNLGFLTASDEEIYQAARDENAVVLTKDHDFVTLLNRKGPPPRVLWLTCGNTSNPRLLDILGRTLPSAFKLLDSGESLVEISDAK